MALGPKTSVAMPTSNEEYRDGALRHAVGIRRYTAGLTKRVSDLLAQAEASLVEKLRVRLPRFENNVTDFVLAKAKVVDNKAAGTLAITWTAEFPKGTPINPCNTTASATAPDTRANKRLSNGLGIM